MAASNSFKIVLAISLLVTVMPKLLLGAGVSNPSYSEIVKIIAPFFTAEGYEVTSPVDFAGKDALLAMKGDCLMYVIPVAHQGWHEATVRQSVGPSENLWFAFEGRLKQRQDTYYPLSAYYINKSARYLGVDADYPPVLAIVTEGTCSIESIHWGGLPRIPFTLRGLIKDTSDSSTES